MATQAIVRTSIVMNHLPYIFVKSIVFSFPLTATLLLCIASGCATPQVATPRDVNLRVVDGNVGKTFESVNIVYRGVDGSTSSAPEPGKMYRRDISSVTENYKNRSTEYLNAAKAALKKEGVASTYSTNAPLSISLEIWIYERKFSSAEKALSLSSAITLGVLPAYINTSLHLTAEVEDGGNKRSYYKYTDIGRLGGILGSGEVYDIASRSRAIRSMCAEVAMDMKRDGFLHSVGGP